LSGIPPALDTARAFKWGLGLMVFLATMGIIFFLSQSNPLHPGLDLAVLFLGVFIVLAVILLCAARKE